MMTWGQAQSSQPRDPSLGTSGPSLGCPHLNLWKLFPPASSARPSLAADAEGLRLCHKTVRGWAGAVQPEVDGLRHRETEQLQAMSPPSPGSSSHVPWPVRGQQERSAETARVEGQPASLQLPGSHTEPRPHHVLFISGPFPEDLQGLPGVQHPRRSKYNLQDTQGRGVVQGSDAPTPAAGPAQRPAGDRRPTDVDVLASPASGLTIGPGLSAKAWSKALMCLNSPSALGCQRKPDQRP